MIACVSLLSTIHHPLFTAYFADLEAQVDKACIDGIISVARRVVPSIHAWLIRLALGK